MPATSSQCFAFGRVLFLAAAGLVLNGCNSADSLVPVHGLVLVDGLPLSGAAVAFEPLAGGAASVAETDFSGRFSLRTQDGRRGALAGMHRVSVLHPEDLQRTPAGTTPGLRNASFEVSRDEPLEIVPRQYSSPATSGLTVEVKPDEMEPVFLKLER